MQITMLQNKGRHGFLCETLYKLLLLYRTY